MVAAALPLADHLDRLVEHPLAGADVVVGLPHAVEVDVDHQALVRRDDPEDLLVEQQRVGAQIDVPLALDQPGDELGQLRVDGRLAAADRHGRRAGVLRRLEAPLDRQPVLELAGVALDGAADARQVAGVERLQHQHVGVALSPRTACFSWWRMDVGGDVEWESHALSLSLARPAGRRRGDGASAAARQRVRLGERAEREVVVVEVVAQVEDRGEAGPRPGLVLPGAVAALRPQQVVDAALRGLGVVIAERDERRAAPTRSGRPCSARSPWAADRRRSAASSPQPPSSFWCSRSQLRARS